jgi:hypothetical protein
VELATLTTLQSLDIQGCGASITDEGVQALTQLPYLTRLCVDAHSAAMVSMEVAPGSWYDGRSVYINPRTHGPVARKVGSWTTAVADALWQGFYIPVVLNSPICTRTLPAVAHMEGALLPFSRYAVRFLMWAGFEGLPFWWQQEIGSGHSTWALTVHARHSMCVRCKE